MTRTRWIAATLLGAFINTHSAAAEESQHDRRIFVSGAGGTVNYPNQGQLGVAPNISIEGATDESESFSWMLGAGYRVTRYIAIEAGYVDLGEESGLFTGSAGADPAQAKTSFSVKGATVALIGILPLERWEPYLKIGVLFADTELAFDGVAGSSRFSGRVSGSTEDLLVGIGTSYVFSERWAAKLDATYFKAAGEPETGHSNILGGWVGLTFRF